MKKKKFTHRRSVGLTPAVAKRVDKLRRQYDFTYEAVLRMLVVEALRSRESKLQG